MDYFYYIIQDLINNGRVFEIFPDYKSITVTVYTEEDLEVDEYKLLFDLDGELLGKFDCDPEGDFQEEKTKVWRMIPEP